MDRRPRALPNSIHFLPRIPRLRPRNPQLSASFAGNSCGSGQQTGATDRCTVPSPVWRPTSILQRNWVCAKAGVSRPFPCGGHKRVAATRSPSCPGPASAPPHHRAPLLPPIVSGAADPKHNPAGDSAAADSSAPGGQHEATPAPARRCPSVSWYWGLAVLAVVISLATVAVQRGYSQCGLGGKWDLVHQRCVCFTGYAGSQCQFSDHATCSGSGLVRDDGSCQCHSGYAGTNCQCSDSGTCLGQGRAQEDCSCACYSGHAGPNCEYSDADTCSGHGTAQDDGSCRCNVGRVGDNCESEKYSWLGSVRKYFRLSRRSKAILLVVFLFCIICTCTPVKRLVHRSPK